MIYILEDNTFDKLAWKGMNSSTLDELYTFLEDKDYRVRTLSAQAIQMKYAEDDVFKKISKMLESKDDSKREVGAYILGQLGTPKMPFAKDSFPLLESSLNDDNEEVLVATISAIGHLWEYTNYVEDKLFNKVKKFIAHKNREIRISSLMALVSTNKEVVNMVNKLLQDKDKEVREWAEVAKEIIEDN